MDLVSKIKLSSDHDATSYELRHIREVVHHKSCVFFYHKMRIDFECCCAVLCNDI